jgi:two-component system, response regulator
VIKKRGKPPRTVRPLPRTKRDDELVFLVAEDNPNDLELLMHSVRKSRLLVNVQVAGDGEETIEYLSGKGKFEDRSAHPFPDVVVLDLKMPRMDGLQVLRWLRQHRQFADLPTIMLSGSGLEKDVQEAYRLGVSTYFTKPYNLQQLCEVVRVMIDYWSRSERPSLRHAV